jgi:hypothetical protein
MKKHLFLAFFIVFSALSAVAQSKPKTSPKPTQSELQKLLETTGLPYKMMNDTVGIVPYEGVNIESFDVAVQKIGDLFIVFTDLAEIMPGKIDDTKYKYLLKENEHFDFIKIGMSNDEQSVYVRSDIFKEGVSTVFLARIIKQVANVTNIIAGEIK